MIRHAPELELEQYGFAKSDARVLSTEGSIAPHPTVAPCDAMMQAFCTPVTRRSSRRLLRRLWSILRRHTARAWASSSSTPFDSPLCSLYMNAAKEFGERQWLAAAFETSASQPLSKDEKIRVAELLTKCDTFDNFMQVRYASVKRYGAEVWAVIIISM